MISWPQLRAKPNISVDIHSHLLPGIDDGVNAWDETIEILRFLQGLGYQKVITTPHIRSDLFPNNPDIIREKYDALLDRLSQEQLSIKVDFAAEYFLDEAFLKVLKSGEELLTFGDSYLLFEVSFYNKPMIFDEVVFEIRSRGLKPVLAHPERYKFLEGDISWLESLFEQDILLQVNLPSLSGAYGKLPRQIGHKLLDQSMVAFLGTDVHRPKQLPLIARALDSRIIKKQPINNTLL